MASLSKKYFLVLIICYTSISGHAQGNRTRDYGIEIGIFKPGDKNAITDVPGVKIGHTTLIKGDNIRTGVTAIIPHDKDIFQWKCPAAIYIGNGFGKLAGYSQVEELGNIETPIILTNTLSVATAMNALISYTTGNPGNENVRSVNGVVGETNDGRLNDIRGRHITEQHVLDAIENAKSVNVQEGNVGAGTGTVCFGYKGGIGTSSRKLPETLGGYTVGVLVQSNFGGVLEISGVPIMKEMGNFPFKNAIDSSDGSCMMVILTDAPVSDRNLKRMAKRAMMGLAKTGGVASNGSGDYVIAVSNYEDNLIPYSSQERLIQQTYIRNSQMTPLFIATIEATEEAIINSLFAAETMKGNGNEILALPVDEVLKIMEKFGRIR